MTQNILKLSLIERCGTVDILLLKMYLVTVTNSFQFGTL
jgi:hypothetical protein